MRSGRVCIPWHLDLACVFLHRKTFCTPPKAYFSYSQVISISDYLHGEQLKDDRGGKQTYRTEQ